MAISTMSNSWIKRVMAPFAAPSSWFSKVGFFHNDRVRALLLLVVSVVVRLPSLSGEFIWDDDFLVRESPFIKSPLLALETFRHYLFPDSFASHYRPVQNLSFMVDYLFWDTNTFGFHLTNLLLHAGSAIALYFLLKQFLQSLSAGPSPRENSFSFSTLAFFGALLWAVHPVHSAAVDYISGRADSLAFLFAASAWLLVFRARTLQPGAARGSVIGLAALLGLLSLCSRETGGIWLLVFVLYTLFFDKNLNRRGKVLSVGLCITLFAFYLALRQLPPSRSGNGPSLEWGASTRVVLMFRSLGDYGRLLIYPSNLHMERTVVNAEGYRDHESWEQAVSAEYLSVAGLVFAALLIAGTSWRGRGRALRIFGAAWFVIGYLPTSNLIGLNATCAEHWLYLPSVGVLIFLLGSSLDLPWRWLRTLPAFASVAVIGLGLRSAVRSSDWTTPERFYERTFAAGGTSVRVATNLAGIYGGQGDYRKAKDLLRRALQITPGYPAAANSLAHILFLEGKTAEADKVMTEADNAAAEMRKTYPHTWLAAVNLAHLRHAEGRDKDALAVADKGRLDYPGTWELVSLESELLRLTKRPGPARQLVSDFARDHWWHYGAELALGRLYAEAGDVDRAAAALRAASRLDVHEVDALNLIAQMRLRQNRFDDAYSAQKSAVARQPDAPRQYALLSDILTRMGQTAKAKLAMAEVARLQSITRPTIPLAN